MLNKLSIEWAEKTDILRSSGKMTNSFLELLTESQRVTMFSTFQVEKERNDQLTGIVTGDTVPEDLLKIELSEQTSGEAGDTGLNMVKEGSPAKSVASSVQHSNRCGKIKASLGKLPN